MAGNCSSDIRRLGSVRNFIQVPSAERCGKKTIYYGKNCQMMEVDGLQQDYRATGTPIRSWNRYAEKYCTIATQQAAPDNQTFTVRFYETCDLGVPLPHTLRDCRVRIINNHGLCKSQGDATGGWTHYQEIIDAVVLGENRGRRTSYDAADDALVDELTFELINIFDASGIYFSNITINNTTGAGVACAQPNLTANDAAFDCSFGCGDSTCGCRTTCNDGTQIFYIPGSCSGNTAQQYLYYTTDGGSTGTVLLLPTPAAGTAATYPKVAIVNGRLYVLAYQNPPTLYSIALNAHGVPTGSWTEESTLGTTGTPGELIEDGGLLHILVNIATGSTYYTLGDGLDPDDGVRFTFPAASNIQKLIACNEDLYVVGDDGYIAHSADGGDSWTTLTAPTTDDLKDVALVGLNLWVAGANGALYRSYDDGATWTQVKLGTTTATFTDITFNGDNIGWAINNVDDPYSTVLGGENATDWINSSPRLINWPTGVTAQKAILPTCADGPKAVNTVLIFGTDAAGDTVAYMGRGRVAGG